MDNSVASIETNSRRLPAFIRAIGANCTPRTRFANINAAGAGLLAILFFFPWASVSCAGRVVSTPTGYNLMTGTLDSSTRQTIALMEGPQALGGGPSESLNREEILESYFPKTRSFAILYFLLIVGFGVYAYRQWAALPTKTGQAEPGSTALAVPEKAAWIGAAFGAATLLLLVCVMVTIGLDMSPEKGPGAEWSTQFAFGLQLSALIAFALCGVGVACALHVRNHAEKAEKLPRSIPAVTGAGSTAAVHGKVLERSEHEADPAPSAGV